MSLSLRLLSLKSILSRRLPILNNALSRRYTNIRRPLPSQVTRQSIIRLQRQRVPTLANSSTNTSSSPTINRGMLHHPPRRRQTSRRSRRHSRNSRRRSPNHSITNHPIRPKIRPARRRGHRASSSRGPSSQPSRHLPHETRFRLRLLFITGRILQMDRTPVIPYQDPGVALRSSRPPQAPRTSQRHHTQTVNPKRQSPTRSHTVSNQSPQHQPPSPT